VCGFAETNPAQIPWIGFDMGASAPDPNLTARGDALCRAEWEALQGKTNDARVIVVIPTHLAIFV